MTVSAGSRYRCALLLTAILGCQSCYYAFDAIDTTYEKGDPSRFTNTFAREVVRPDVQVSFEGSGLLIQSRNAITCEQVQVVTSTVETTEVNTLPWHYWFAAAGAATAFGYGVNEWAAGLDAAAPYERLEVGLPAQERAYDDAISREFWGIWITAIAAIPVTMFIVDFAMASDESAGVSSSDETQVMGTSDCGSRPAARDLVLRHGAREQATSVGSAGTLRLPGNALQFLGISKDPIVIEGDEIEVVIPMDPAWLAGWVIEHGDANAQQRFLQVFGGNPAAAQVQLAIRTRAREGQQKRAAQAAADFKAARRHLGRKEYAAAIASASGCLNQEPSHQGCAQLVVKIVGQLQGRSHEDEELLEAVDLCMNRVEQPLCAKVDARIARDEQRSERDQEAASGWHDTIVGYEADEDGHPFRTYLRYYAAWRTTQVAPWIRARVKARWKRNAASFCKYKKRSIAQYGQEGWRWSVRYYCEGTPEEGDLDLTMVDEALGEMEETQWHIVNEAACFKLLNNPPCG